MIWPGFFSQKKIIFKPWNVISGASSQLSQCFCRQLLLANPWLTCCSLYQKFPWNDIGSSGFHVCSRINAVFTGETQKPKTKTTMLEAVNLKKATPEQVEPLENPHQSHVAPLLLTRKVQRCSGRNCWDTFRCQYHEIKTELIEYNFIVNFECGCSWHEDCKHLPVDILICASFWRCFFFCQTSRRHFGE